MTNARRWEIRPATLTADEIASLRQTGAATVYRPLPVDPWARLMERYEYRMGAPSIVEPQSELVELTNGCTTARFSCLDVGAGRVNMSVHADEGPLGGQSGTLRIEGTGWPGLCCVVVTAHVEQFDGGWRWRYEIEVAQ